MVSFQIPVCFNPLRGLGPRRTIAVCHQIHAIDVSIRSAAWGRGERQTLRRLPFGTMFQSAPRLGAAENETASKISLASFLFQSAPRLGAAENTLHSHAGTDSLLFQSAPRLGAAENFAAHLISRFVPGFNPLRGLGPRRTSLSASRASDKWFQSAPRLGAAENCLALNSALITGDSRFSANHTSPNARAVPITVSGAKKSSLFKELPGHIPDFAKPPHLRVHLGFAERIIWGLLFKFMFTSTLSARG